MTCCMQSPRTTYSCKQQTNAALFVVLEQALIRSGSLFSSATTRTWRKTPDSRRWTSRCDDRPTSSPMRAASSSPVVSRVVVAYVSATDRLTRSLWSEHYTTVTQQINAVGLGAWWAWSEKTYLLRQVFSRNFSQWTLCSVHFCWVWFVCPALRTCPSALPWLYRYGRAREIPL